MRLLLVRHAVTEDTGSILTGRASRVPLSPAGHDMAREAAAGLAHLPIAVIYSSPILRCRQTARHLGEATGAEVRQLRGLIETDFGAWTGRRLGDLRKLKAWSRLAVAPSRFRFPDGESITGLQARSVAAIEELAQRHRRQTVAAVTHNDVIRVIVAHYLGVPLDLFHRIDVGPASVSVLDLSEVGVARVPVVNSMDHARWR